MKTWRRLQRARRKKHQPRRRLTKDQILALHEQYLDSIRDWNPNSPCHWCHKPFGKRLSPVTTSGYWFHFNCVHEYFEFKKLEKVS